MHSFTLEDFITIRGTNNTVTQAQSNWLDLASYQDAIFIIDCKEASPAGSFPTINLQTSPTLDDSLFQNMSTATIAVGITTVKVILSTNPAQPLARFVRWQLTGTATPYDATFRILVAANAVM